MYWLVAFPTADSVDLVREGDVVTMYFVGIDADNGTCNMRLEQTAFEFDQCAAHHIFHASSQSPSCSIHI